MHGMGEEIFLIEPIAPPVTGTPDPYPSDDATKSMINGFIYTPLQRSNLLT